MCSYQDLLNWISYMTNQSAKMSFAPVPWIQSKEQERFLLLIVYNTVLQPSSGVRICLSL